MNTFNYNVSDELGLHARPASKLVKLGMVFKCKLNIEKNGKTVDAKRMFSVMGLGVKKGDSIIVTADGEDEEAAIGAVKALFKEENL